MKKVSIRKILDRNWIVIMTAIALLIVGAIIDSDPLMYISIGMNFTVIFHDLCLIFGDNE